MSFTSKGPISSEVITQRTLICASIFAFILASNAEAADGAPTKVGAPTPRVQTASQFAQVPPRVEFNIPAQPLFSAIQAFARQSGLHFDYSAALIEGLRSNGVSGTDTREEALAILLAGTDISYRFSARDTVALMRKVAEKVGGEEIVVTGTYRSLLGRHPGSGTVISLGEIEAFHPLSTIDLLRRTPGIHAPSEYGRGLRPNIGIRGSNPVRSRNVLLLADGVPIQPAVYGDPASYYNVPVEQVERIEIIRGGASALYGPNTGSGVVNYILRPPPEKREIKLSETVRRGGFFTSSASYGDTLGKTGVLFTYNNKTGSLQRDNTHTFINDVTLRFVPPLGDDGKLDLRVSYYDEEAQTPGGLTVAQFNANPNFSQRSSDVFFGRRFASYLRIQQPIFQSAVLDVQTYINSFERNWFIADGIDTAATTNTQFLRDFVVAGVEPKLRWTANKRVDIVVGGRIHFEEEEDIRRQGNSPGARAGTTDREAELQTLAVAAFANATLELVDGLFITPGIRYESVDQDRKVGLRSGAGGTRGSLVTNEVVGGVGILQQWTDTAELFANYSRSFQPPTFNEAVDPTSGTPNDLSAETSNNFEVGFRGRFTDWLFVDAAAFWNKFSNQIISEAGMLTNGGKTRRRGFEGKLNLGPWDGFTADLSATFVDTEFLVGANLGNDLPEAPEILLSWTLAYAFSTNVGSYSMQLDGNFVDERFTDAANTVPENADGKSGLLPSYSVANLRLEFHPDNTRFDSWKVFGGINNLFDRKYRIRRQSFFNGIIPGSTRSFFVGVAAEY